MKHSGLSIFFHNFYGQHEKWIKLFKDNLDARATIYYNIVDSIYNLEEKAFIKNGTFKNDGSARIYFFRSSNIGKDIGGKMIMMDAFLRLQDKDDYIVFIHDKNSPHKIQNEAWKQKLLRIIEPQFIEQAVSILTKDNKTGIISGVENIFSEYDHTIKSYKSNNKTQLENLQNHYNIGSTDHLYIAGAMFWARSLPLVQFFQKYPPLDIRANLEKGNVMDDFSGTNTHAWERLLSWIITAQGFGIKGI